MFREVMRTAGPRYRALFVHLLKLNYMSAIEAILKITAKVTSLSALDIISIRPEDESGNRWLYISKDEPATEYYIDLNK